MACAKVLFAPDGTSLQYGYVQYNEAAHAQMAIKTADGTKLKGQSIKVSPFLSRAQRLNLSSSRFTNVFVKQFPDSVTEEHHLEKLFEGFGEVAGVFLPKVWSLGLFAPKSDDAVTQSV